MADTLCAAEVADLLVTGFQVKVSASRRRAAYAEVASATRRLFNGEKIEYDEIAGILIEYYPEILESLEGRK